MKVVKINSADIDYISGHLRYGHFEGELSLDDNEYEQFINDPAEFLNNSDSKYKLNLVVDDYSIEDCGDICSVEWENK